MGEWVREDYMQEVELELGVGVEMEDVVVVEGGGEMMGGG